MSLTALFALCGGAAAQQVTVADVEALPGETVSMAIQLNTNGGSYTGLEFDIQFPDEGFTTTGKATMTNTGWDGAFTIGDIGGVGISNLARCGVLSYSDTAIPGDGLQPFGTVEFTVGSGVALGNYTVTLTNMTLIGEGRVPVADATFTLSVVNTHSVVLDETSTTAPEAAEGVNVRVKRTIKANEWSTICLPFEMSAAQVKAAFGDDVQLADFNGYVFDDDAETITVNFKDATAIEANHPYIIKVSSKVEEFAIDGVDIDPEDEPMVNKGTSRKPKAIIGTYVANTVIENGNLFLSGNQFWYSVGNTKMKAFRAYFNFFDLLPDFEANYAESRIVMSFGDETTGIESLTPDPSPTGEGSIYNLNGQRVEHPAKKGLYIKNGRKEVIK